MADKLKVFLCHASENKPIVNNLYDDLVASGYQPWLDTEVLLPGMDWDLEIKKGLRASDAVIVCLSSTSVGKEGYIQKELRFAQGIQDEKPRGTIFLIPLRLEKCDTPYDLQDIQWSDYTASDGFEKLVRGLNIRAEQLGRKLGEAKKKTTLTPDGEIPPVGDLPLGSYLPFSPNPLFTGRVDDLQKLADALVIHAQAGTVITQAVTGMGGLGKTQLAVEFAYRYGKYFQGVHWLNLADPTTLDSEIALCGGKMGLDNWPDDQPSQVSMTELAWKVQGPRLLILDNFEDVPEANHVLSRLRHQNIRLLITSRHSDCPATTGLPSIPLELFSKEESLAFLKESMKKRKDKDDELNTLSERLGYLPLALELASRYLNDHPRLDVSAYLEQAKEALEHASMNAWHKDILGLTPTQHDTSLLSTFALSWLALSAVEGKDETAQKMFQMAGYLAPNTAIPLGIFEKALEITSEICDENLMVLYGLGLLRESESLPTIHPLLAEYARGLSRGNVKVLEVLADTLGILSSEANQTGLPSRFIPFRSHIPVTASHAEEKNLQDAGFLWNEFGYHLRNMVADYIGARAAYERALKIDEASFGPDHPEVAIDVNNLGSVMQDLGDLVGARAAFERALKIDEASFGPDHPNVARDVNNLGVVMKEQDDLVGARAAFERALKIDEASFGPDHPNVAIRVNNLGDVLQDQGDLDGAHVAYERALKIFEANLGEDHPNVATVVNNLGVVMQEQDDLISARVAFERALKIGEASFGLDHPKVAIRANNLARVMQAQGDLVGARVAFERALATFKKFLPPDHPDIKTVQENLDSLDQPKT